MRRRWAAALAAALLLLPGTARPALAGPPITTAIYPADPAALAVGDTLYLYTGHDEAPTGGTNFVMRDWHLFTSSDATTFTDQGARLSLANFPHSHGAYGNWNHQGTEWLEYRWPAARTISRSEVYWFDDGLGIDLPASCRLQYWNGGAYVDLAGCGVAGDTFNPITFSPVSTTRLRLNITSRTGSSTGVLEWRAFS
ncbi:hypothetical protein AB0M50_51900 [Nonomuraea fuscirosea]|uniref:hypothetical protein n=1 Tax=Nonomuraea fuscirosea TaxID=1291556 RepID=UPI0034398A6A